MFIGHYCASLVAKRIVPDAPLWLLLLAAQLVDIFWAVFILGGVERGRIVAGFTQSNPLDLYYMPYTHSLPAAALWSVGLGLLVFALLNARLGTAAARAVALAAALVVASHWVLDWIVHKPDLGLWGDQFKVGFGLWDDLWISLALEYGLLFAAAFYLHRDARVWRAAGGRGLVVLLLVMALIHLANVFGPLPPSMTAVGWSGLAIYLLFAAAAAWLERRESMRV
jgi:hypothetical protein